MDYNYLKNVSYKISSVLGIKFLIGLILFAILGSTYLIMLDFALHLGGLYAVQKLQRMQMNNFNKNFSRLYTHCVSYQIFRVLAGGLATYFLNRYLNKEVELNNIELSNINSLKNELTQLKTLLELGRAQQKKNNRSLNRLPNYLVGGFLIIFAFSFFCLFVCYYFTLTNIR